MASNEKARAVDLAHTAKRLLDAAAKHLVTDLSDPQIDDSDIAAQAIELGKAYALLALRAQVGATND